MHYDTHFCTIGEFIFILLSIPQRNVTLTETATMHTGHSGMEKFGYIDKLNGLDNLSAWKEKPCNNVSNSLSNVK